jgi:predicted alpha/beta superfamily hydrolase
MRILLPIFLLAAFHHCFAQLPRPSSGKIIRWELGDRDIPVRNVDIWLPEDYTPSRKYAVLYMHDGQMLFDSTSNWNKQEWMVDEWMTKLMKERKIRETIVVGIFNNGKYRHQEYFPEKALNLLDTVLSKDIIKNELQGRAMSDEYLSFLVYTLKPRIDSAFSTKPDRSNTFISGSSMGGLVSMYAICEYSQVFGGAACLSTHWIGSLQRMDEAIPKAFNAYLEQNLPDPKHHKIYFDLGDASLDSLYPKWQALVDITMTNKAYGQKKWITRSFPGDDHSERAWARRLDIPLVFLLAGK